MQLAIADTPEAFGARCSELLLDPMLRGRLASAAFKWVLANHGVSRAPSLLPPCISVPKNTSHSQSGSIPAISAEEVSQADAPCDLQRQLNHPTLGSTG